MPSRGFNAELLEQVKRVAFAREHLQAHFPIEGSAVGGEEDETFFF